MKNVPLSHNVWENKHSDNMVPKGKRLFIPKRQQSLDALMKRAGRRYPWQIVEKTQRTELYLWEISCGNAKAPWKKIHYEAV